jgi:hypothetical protein
VEGADRRAALAAHLDKIERAARETLDDPADLADFTATADAARKHLAAPGPLETLTPDRQSSRRLKIAAARLS